MTTSHDFFKLHIIANIAFALRIITASGIGKYYCLLILFILFLSIIIFAPHLKGISFFYVRAIVLKVTLRAFIVASG